jgi:hypothetical protein
MATQPQSEQQVVSVSLPKEEFAALEQLAQAENTSVTEYVRTEMLHLVRTKARPRRSREDLLAIIRAAQDEVRRANPSNRDLLAELLEERRREAALG